MAEFQGSRTDTIARPRRAGNQAAVDYRRLHRGLSLARDDGDGADVEVRVVAGAKTKQATGDTSAKAGDKTPQVQILQRVLEQLTSAGNQMKQMEQQYKQIEDRMARMPEIVQDQLKVTIQEQVKAIVQEQVTNIVQQQVTKIIQQQVTVIVREQVATAIQQQLANIAVPSTGERSYADVARTPPDSQPSNLRSLSMNSTPSTWTDTLYCTLDTSQAEEGEKGKTNPSTVRKAIETQLQTTVG
jgi:peptidoglycan hydrolase-like protein with peptidoglycan-binding domain